MSNVISIASGIISAVDVNKIVQTSRDISRLTNFKNALSDDVLHERARQVAAYLKNIDTTMRESFPMLLTALSNSYGQSFFDTLDELKGALDRKDLGDSDRDLVSKEFLSIKGNIELMLNEVAAKFNDRSRLLDKEVISLYKVEIGDRTDQPLKLARDLMDRVLAQLNEQNLKKSTCVEQRDTLIKAQDVIRQTNLADIFQTYLPDAGALSSLDLATPEKEAIKQAIALLKKILGVVSDGIKYIELATARTNLDKEIDVLNQSISGLNGELKSAENTLSDVSAVAEISLKRLVAGKKIDIVVGIWIEFSTNLAVLKSGDYSEADLATFLNRYKTHLEVLTKDYNSVMIN
ncbi:alpha-xenorhabdolysin family binary toxin subunit B [Pseudomonas shahriarae]|uniref:alpha-xenorhabdolysin family binary toxin subunit B n=1 Tax=Pseudomonas shahriarae TaxID=2745512 RepID=UPI00236089C9|nr:alpha-xenorhabdolysin family binary toxin subunit B [Pseudomonas shahriarae]MDD0980443.1 alpha-xenorhabdolysin family binary toxin subunit B [Pseudomonas shahriarae]